MVGKQLDVRWRTGGPLVELQLFWRAPSRQPKGRTVRVRPDERGVVVPQDDRGEFVPPDNRV